MRTRLITGCLVVFLAVSASWAQPLGTAFTYQGRLKFAGSPANGSFNMDFKLYPVPAGGTLLASQTLPGVSVTDGLFTVQVDFGAGVFDGNQRWLDVTVNGSPLVPRQALTATPYAAGLVLPLAESQAVGGIGNALLWLTNFSNDGGTIGIKGQANSNNSDATGVFGYAQSGSAATIGVKGESISINGRGVLGVASAASGDTFGVFGTASSPAGTGVYGLHALNTGTAPGVWGYTNSSTDGASGVSGFASGLVTSLTSGVYGVFLSGTGVLPDRGSGVLGDSAGGYGVSGLTQSGRGVSGVAVGGFLGPGIGVYGSAPASGYAGYFAGPLTATGIARFDAGVGIGTGLPAGQQLHILAPQAVVGMFSSSNPNGSVLVLESGVGGSPLVGAINFATPTGTPGQIAYGPANNMTFRANAAERMRITSAGSVGIGTTAPAFLLEVNGAAGKPGGGSWSSSSDLRVKKNIQPLTHALDDLLRLRGVTFEYTDPAWKGGVRGTQIGMIAQEVEPVFPQWVGMDPDGYRTLAFSGFEALTVESLRELSDCQRQEDESLRATIEDLRNRNADLTARVERLEAALRLLTPEPAR